MKLSTLFTFFFCLLLIPLQNVSAQNIGLITKASTSGVGGELGYRFSDKFILKAGYETIDLEYSTTFTESDFSIDAGGSFSTNNASLLMDYQLFSFLYISTGLLLNNTAVTVSGTFTEDYIWGDVVIPKEEMGSIEWKITPQYAFSPYVGFGFGNNLSHSRRLSYSFEIGGFFQGSPQIDISSDGILAPNQDPEINQSGMLENQISKYRFYPTIKLLLGINILRFK